MAKRKLTFPEVLYVYKDVDSNNVYEIAEEHVEDVPEGRVGIYKLIEVKKKVNSYELV